MVEYNPGDYPYMPKDTRKIKDTPLDMKDINEHPLTMEIKTESGLKSDAGKLDYSLIPFEALEEMIKVLMYGVVKYKRDNWQLVEDSENRYFSATMRHLIAWKKGEKVDNESGLNHLAHAAVSIMFILWKDLTKKQ